ncbi:MAG: thioredoxin domain-containing protein [Pseudomonadota bacterium]
MSFATRRTVLLGASALPLLGALPAFASTEAKFTDDFSIGADDAPVTVYEYISYTCGYCGQFHQVVWPEIQEAYVDSGKARFILRPFYRNTVDLDIDMLARCGGPDNFYALIDVYLNEQSLWTRAQDINFAVTQIARRAGMPQATIDECLADYEFKKTLVEAFRTNAAEHEVEATPTFIVGDEVHRGLATTETLSGLIDNELGV